MVLRRNPRDDPDIRALYTEIAALRDNITEKDRRYTERFDAAEKSVKTALDAAEKAVNAALVAAEKAVNKAEVAQGMRNEAQNEFRGQLKDQAESFITRVEAFASITSLREM